MKLRGVREGRKLKDVAADLLRAALAPGPATADVPAAAVPKTLPVLKATRPVSGAAADAQEFGQFVKQADMDLEVA